MDRIQETANATSVKFLKTTPALLRQLATRLEQQAKEATLPGELVVYPLTRSLTLVYDPDLSLSAFKRNAPAEPFPVLAFGPDHGHPEPHPDDLEGGP